MDFEQIKSEYRCGARIAELSEKYGISQSRIRYRCKKDGWDRDDKFGPIRDAAVSTARLLSIISRKNEELISSGERIEARDVKYLTAAEKELLEVLREVYSSDGDGKGGADGDINFIKAKNEMGSDSGIILIPSLIASEE